MAETEDLIIRGVGTFTLPNDMTPEEAERLAREADEQRKEP